MKNNFLSNYFFEEERHYLALELSRILFYFILLIQFEKFTYYLHYSRLPIEFFHSNGLLQNPSILLFLGKHVEVILYIIKFFIITSMFGFFSTISKWVVFVFTLIIFNVPYAYKADFLLATPNVFLCLVFALSKAGRFLSIDSYVFKKRIFPQYDYEYSWPIKFSKLIYVTVFFSAALLKLKNVGIEWVFSDNLKNIFLCSPFNRGDIVSNEIMNWKLNYLISNWPSVVQFFALITLIFELAVPISMFEFRLSKLPIYILALMQIGSVYFLYLNPNDNIALYVCWINWDSLLRFYNELFKKSKDIAFQPEPP